MGPHIAFGGFLLLSGVMTYLNLSICIKWKVDRTLIVIQLRGFLISAPVIP